MKQLSDRDRKKAMDVLAKCAAATKDIKDPDELNEAVYGILHEAFPNQPQMIKRACQAYNSAKSIHKLSTADDSNRGDDFSILDPNAMCDRAKRECSTAQIRKAASAFGIKSATFSKDTNKPMAKAASAVESKNRSVKTQEDQTSLSDSQVKRLIRENLSGLESCIIKCASAGNGAAREFEKAKKDFIRKFASETTNSRKATAELLYAKYGETGEAMINLFNEAEPLKKVASYNKARYKGSVSLPNTEIYKKASALVNASENLRQSEDRSMLALDTTLAFVRDLQDSRGLKKEAAVSPIHIASTALGVASAKEVPELLDLDDPSESKLRKSIYDTEFLNRIKEHSIRRAFMDMLLDQSIQKYPLDKILAAYNTTLKETPLSLRGVPDTANLGLVKSRTLALLGRGGIPSAGDADTIMNIQKVYGKIDPESLLIKSKDSEEA